MHIPLAIKIAFGAITIIGGLYLYYSIYVQDAPSIYDKKDARWWDDLLGSGGYGTIKEFAVIGFVIGVISFALFLFVIYFPDNSMTPLFEEILDWLDKTRKIL